MWHARNRLAVVQRLLQRGPSRSFRSARPSLHANAPENAKEPEGLMAYSVDLVEQARENKLDPVFGQ
jgi:ATP-dependent Clp protease ATP-binding subunit ClpA